MNIAELLDKVDAFLIVIPCAAMAGVVWAIARLRYLKKRRGYRLHALSSIQAQQWAESRMANARKR